MKEEDDEQQKKQTHESGLPDFLTGKPVSGQKGES